jgi:hypothetical protein
LLFIDNRKCARSEKIRENIKSTKKEIIEKVNEIKMKNKISPKPNELRNSIFLILE